MLHLLRHLPSEIGSYGGLDMRELLRAAMQGYG
jgi:hypothetical protein